ncbi:hypothetical protein ACFQ3Z_43735 [Streptomyces nogalater]
MEEARPQRMVFAVEVQRGGADDWCTQAVTPSWFYGYHAADAAVQAFDRYMAHHRQTVAALVAPDAPGLRVLVRVQEPAAPRCSPCAASWNRRCAGTPAAVARPWPAWRRRRRHSSPHCATRP